MAEQGWTLPDWLALHVGRITVENLYLREQLATVLAQQTEATSEPSPPPPVDTV